MSAQRYLLMSAQRYLLMSAQRYVYMGALFGFLCERSPRNVKERTSKAALRRPCFARDPSDKAAKPALGPQIKQQCRPPPYQAAVLRIHRESENQPFRA